MPAKSKSQQRLFGMVHAYQKGKLKHVSKNIEEIAAHISEEDAEHFAKTKHKKLPEKKAERLYTYLPKDNTALTDGLLSTALSPSGWEKYKGRTGKSSRDSVLKVLDSWEPEWTRSKAVSALSEPIPEDAADDFLEFALNRKLYSFDTKDLIKAKILTHLRLARNGGGSDHVDEVKPLKPNWHRKKKHLLFQGVPHYFVETKDGKIPPEFVSQEKKASDSEDEKLREARAFVEAVRKLALKRRLNFFLVTDGASGISNNGNPAVRNAREAQIKWELEHGSDPYEDWLSKSKNEKKANIQGVYDMTYMSKIAAAAIAALASAPATSAAAATKPAARPQARPVVHRVAKPAARLVARPPAQPVARTVAKPVAKPAPAVKTPTKSEPVYPTTGPVGYRKNNAGNLKSDGKTKWQGATAVPAKGEIIEFENWPYGVRAMARTLYNYGKLHNINTTRGVIKRYAPAVENNQEAYLRSIQQRTGFKPDDVIDLTDEGTLQTLVPAMGKHEIGPTYWDTYDAGVVSNTVHSAITPTTPIKVK